MRISHLEVSTALQEQQEKCSSTLGSPDGKQGSLRCLPGGSALELLPKVDQVVALQHAKRDLKHLLQTLLPANCNTDKKPAFRAALAQRLHDEMLLRQDQQAGGASMALGKMSTTSYRAVLQRQNAYEPA